MNTFPNSLGNTEFSEFNLLYSLGSTMITTFSDHIHYSIEKGYMAIFFSVIYKINVRTSLKSILPNLLSNVTR